MTYTNIPPISYIFVGITTAILSYVTWAELQQDHPEMIAEIPPITEDIMIKNEETPLTTEDNTIKTEDTPTTEEKPTRVEEQPNIMPGGRKRKGTKKGRRKQKKITRTRHKKLKFN
jgi:hypothetical protein